METTIQKYFHIIENEFKKLENRNKELKRQIKTTVLKLFEISECNGYNLKGLPMEMMIF
jgi:hypothetical protein